MLRICRAEDGEIFQFDGTLWDIERHGNLEGFLHGVLGVAPEDAVAYLSNGVRLTNENIRELAGSSDDKIFVFDQYYLDYELEDALQKLRFNATLQPHVEDPLSSTPPIRLSQVAAAFLRTAHTHQDVVTRVVSTIGVQHEALQIASRTLDMKVLMFEDTYEIFETAARPDLDKQATLLSSLELDLDMISRIAIHMDFISEGTRKAIEGGERPRTLGDYVSREKMLQVGTTCAKLHAELVKRFDTATGCMLRLKEGSASVRNALSSSRYVEQAESSKRRVEEAVEKITDVSTAIKPSGFDNVLQVLKQADLDIRYEVEVAAQLKNASTELCIRTLRSISLLGEDLSELPSVMTQFTAEIRVKNNFQHVQRLHNMLYAYGATLIEVVRRKEFSRFFYQRAQNILEVMANLSSTEQKRRKIFRSEVFDLVPFQLKRMDEPAPTIDFTPTEGLELEYGIERPDVEAYMELLDVLRTEFAKHPGIGSSALLEIRDGLMKLITRMDSLEGLFERVVERSMLSGSRLSSSRRRLNEFDEAAFLELQEQLVRVQLDKEERQRKSSAEKEAMRAEIARLRSALDESRQATEREQERSDSLSRDVHVLRAQNESDAQARRVLEQRHNELLADVEHLRRAQVDNLSSATEQAKEAETLRQELMQTKAEFRAVKDLEAAHSQKIKQLLEDQSLALARLEEARQRGEDLQSQIKAARKENDDVNHALKEASEEKDKLLRAQALEHDRIMRDHIAEADGDRAVLERHFFEARAALEDNERRLKEALSKTEVLTADAVGLREELQHTEYALREARHIERVLRNDLNAGRASQTDFEKKISDRDRLIAEILDVAINFRDSHNRAFAQLQQMSVHPGSGSKSNTNGNLTDSVLSPAFAQTRMTLTPLREEALAIDPTDPASALETLRTYDLDAFSEAVTKVGSVMRKLLKQCKDYRERAKGKISFRNFAKGDLALFLPTRNSQSKPWAAFNVSFPHYFLSATGRLAEQLKSREWIVARITSLTERVALANDPSTNPYGLGDGTKYYLLEVEDWTQPGGSAAKRRKPARPTSPDTASSPPHERPISPPLADSVQQGVTAAESLGATRSPTSHLFPVRTRSTSTSAGPSSLSRLLAQATPDAQLETTPSIHPVNNTRPAPFQPAPPSPTRQVSHTPGVPSPLRPGSRASSSSRLSFSGGRIPPFPTSSSSGSANMAKAAPTTALSGEATVSSPPTSSSVSSTTERTRARLVDRRSSSPLRESSATPSPTHSATEGLANVLPSRRPRTTSEHVSSTESNRHSIAGPIISNPIASLASWSVSIGRRKRTSAAQAIANETGRSTSSRPSTPASELLKKF